MPENSVSFLQITLDRINAFIIASKTTTANYKGSTKLEQGRRLSTENFKNEQLVKNSNSVTVAPEWVANMKRQ